MDETLADLAESPAARASEGLVGELFAAVHRLAARGDEGDLQQRLTETCRLVEEAVRRVLGELKETLIEIVSAFEQLARVADACRALPLTVKRYQKELRATLERVGSQSVLAARPPGCARKPSARRQVVTNASWVMEESDADNVVVLRRLPVDFTSTQEATRHNDDIIRSVRPEHGGYGVRRPMMVAVVMLRVGAG